MKTLGYVGWTRFAAVFMGILFILTALGAGGAQAATITVANANDSGPGSLRQAILDAKLNDKVNFAGDYIILLASTLTIDKNLTIDGTGNTIIVDGQKKARVFRIDKSAAVILKGLAIRNGQAYEGDGGGIWNAGDLTVEDCTLSDNSATYGGGIYNNEGKLTMGGSTLTGNTALHGGGICNTAKHRGVFLKPKVTIINDSTNGGSFYTR